MLKLKHDNFFCRPKSVTDESDRDLPSYMRSTSASVKKEKMVASPSERIRCVRGRHSCSSFQGTSL
jgi:hypothetical protein